MSSITLTFPDGNQKQFPAGISGGEVAESIAKSLAKKSVAYALDGELRDLSDPIEADGAIELVTRSDARALELIRHDAAHVMAEAVQELWPGTQVTIGAVIENGFYYDFARNEPFTPDDFPAIEKKMRNSPAPSSRAAMTKSSVRSVRKRPRTTRASPVQPTSDRMMVIIMYCSVAGQSCGKAAASASQIGIVGRASTNSTTR